MPITNLSERKMSLGQCGSIRKGIKVPVIDPQTQKPKKKNGQIVTYPKEVDYFVFKPDEAMTDLVEQVQKLYGDQPKSFVAFLASNVLERAWDYWYEAYNFNGLIARSDGTIVTRLFDTETNQKIIERGVVVEMPNKDGTACYDLIQGQNLQLGDMLAYFEGMVLSRTQNGDPIFFDAHGRLNVVLRDLRRRLYWTVHTGGLYGDVPHITQQVQDIQMMSEEISRVANLQIPISMIPFSLTRVEVERRYMDQGKRKSRKGWDILMEVEKDFFSGYLEMFAKTPLALSITNPELPAIPTDYVTDTEPLYLADEIPGTIENENDVGYPSWDELKQETAAAIEQREKDKQIERPFTPENLKDWFDNRVKFHQQKRTQVPKNYPQIVAAKLNAIFGNDTDRYIFTAWLTGKGGSTKVVNSSEIQALIDWLEVGHFNDEPNEYCEREAIVCLEFANALNGQQTMEL